MKQNLKLILILCILTVFLTLLPSIIYSQSEDCPDIVDPDVPCPIDGGVATLLAVGIFYGIKKIYGIRKRHEPIKVD